LNDNTKQKKVIKYYREDEVEDEHEPFEESNGEEALAPITESHFSSLLGHEITNDGVLRSGL